MLKHALTAVVAAVAGIGAVIQDVDFHHLMQIDTPLNVLFGS